MFTNHKLLPGIFIVILVISSLELYSQDTNNDVSKEKFRNRIYVGGNIGLQFGTVTFIDISPLVGYRITDKLSAGIGFTYWYFKDNRILTDINPNVYGGRIFGKYYLFPNVFAYSEYEVLNMEVITSIGSYNYLRERMNVESLFIGGGYSQRIGEHASFNLLLLWNLNESDFSPYFNPVFRTGFNIGL